MAERLENIDKRYEGCIERLSDFLWREEIRRREWAHERWANPDGFVFKLFRWLILLFSVYTLISLFIYCMIRDSQVMLSKLYDSMNGVSMPYDADTAHVNLIIGAVLVICAAVIVGNVILIFKKYRAGSYVVGISSLAAAVHLLTQLNIGMPKDNNKYVIFCIINCIVYAVAAFMCGYIVYALGSRKRFTKKAVDSVLTKFINNSGDILEKKDYCELIDEYIEKKGRKK